jgi:hypothetical protein
MIGHRPQTRDQSARSATNLSVAFQDAAVDLAEDLCEACRPMLPVHQARGLRVDELTTTAGLERQSPMAAAVMALGPAIAAAGAGVSAIPGMAWLEASRTVDVAESVVGVGFDALALAGGGAGGRLPSVTFAHRLAHATHLATALAQSPPALAGGGAGGYPPRAPALWPQLIDSLSTRIRVKQHWKDGPGLADWRHRVQAASACHDAAAHGMGAHAAVLSTRTASSTERLLRCLTFATLYCGFAMLERPPWTSGRPAASAEHPAAERGPVQVQLWKRLAYPFRPDGQGATAL